MRQIDPFTGPRVWSECRPALKKLLVKGAKLPESVALLPYERLNFEQITAIATAAARLEWQAGEMTAMAPLVAADAPRKREAPLPVITMT